MALRIGAITARDLAEFRLRLRRVKYKDIYQALRQGRAIQVDADSEEELERCRRSVCRWIRRQGLSVQRAKAGKVMMLSPLLGQDGPQEPTGDAQTPPMVSRVLPVAARPGKGLGAPLSEWEKLQRPPDPPSWERLMNPEKKSP